MCCRLFSEVRNIAKFFTGPILKNIYKLLLLKRFTKLRKNNICCEGIINSTLETTENKYLFIFVPWLVSFGVCIYIQYFFYVVRNKLQTINICNRVRKMKIKSSRKEYVTITWFKFWPMENFFRKLFKPMGVWLWLVYHFTRRYCCLPSSFKIKRGILPLLRK